MNGDNGYHMPIPINYFMIVKRRKFISCGTGHKVDALKASDKVCFTVYGMSILLNLNHRLYVQKCDRIWKMPFIRGRSESIARLKRILL